MPGHRKHPFAAMEVGDIVEIKEDTKRLQAYVHAYGKRIKPERKFSTRTENNTLIVERVE